MITGKRSTRPTTNGVKASVASGAQLPAKPIAYPKGVVRKTIRMTVVGFALSGLVSGGDAPAQTPVGTAFTYQGQLKQGGIPADGEYDFVFRLFDAASGPSQVGSDESVNDWPVSDGLFTVQIDFGAGVFTGDALWVEVAVRPGDSSSDHTVLTPRQPVAAALVQRYWTPVLGLWQHL